MTKPAMKPLPMSEDDAKTERALEHARQGIGIPLEEIEAWVESWDTEDELPRPQARKLF